MWRFCSVVVITFASCAKGPWSKARWKHTYLGGGWSFSPPTNQCYVSHRHLSPFLTQPCIHIHQWSPVHSPVPSSPKLESWGHTKTGVCFCVPCHHARWHWRGPGRRSCLGKEHKPEKHFRWREDPLTKFLFIVVLIVRWFLGCNILHSVPAAPRSSKSTWYHWPSPWAAFRFQASFKIQSLDKKLDSQRGPAAWLANYTLDVTLCYCWFEILTNFSTESPLFSFCAEPTDHITRSSSKSSQKEPSCDFSGPYKEEPEAETDATLWLATNAVHPPGGGGVPLHTVLRHVLEYQMEKIS